MSLPSSSPGQLPSSSLVAVLDACVLVPAALCDFLLCAASVGLYHLRWTDAILDEVRRTLVADLGRSQAQADRRVAAMRQAFPSAMVTSHQQLIPAMPSEVDAKDRHVVAAAVAAGAPVIVTSNLRDFPAPALAPLGIEAQSPDDFLLQLYALAARRCGRCCSGRRPRSSIRQCRRSMSSRCYGVMRPASRRSSNTICTPNLN